MIQEIFFYLIIIFNLYIVIELFLSFIIIFVRKKFQWLIVSKFDKKPHLFNSGLEKFIHQGFDPKLGWSRKPNTHKEEQGKNGTTNWNINSKGCRVNPHYDEKDSFISCYGDSFTFCRQVNDDETWEHYLSNLENSNVKNFGVGNYGLDQSFLRLQKEFPKNKTKIVILAVVPDTICRIMSSWKHYYEYGNTFAFKPIFQLINYELKLIDNPINEQSKFEIYEKYLEEIQKTDYFYKNKFLKEILYFPYVLTLFKNPRRNFSIIYWVLKIEIFKKLRKNISLIEWEPMKIIMRINLDWRIKLFQNNQATNLLEKILMEYVNFASKNNFIPIFTFLPQKDDLNYIRQKNNFFYDIEKKLTNINGLNVIPITEILLSKYEFDKLYSDDNDYGGHFSKEGNKLIADIIHEFLGSISK